MSVTFDQQTAEKCVERGVKFLNGVKPGWFEEIDLETLDLARGSRCVLGQLYGDFHDGVRLFTKRVDWDEKFAWATARGFALPEMLDDGLLTPIWLERIRELSLSA